MERNKIFVAQYWTSNLSYAKYTKAINEKYCNDKGYRYFYEDNSDKILNTLLDRQITWYKPKFILSILENHNPEYILFLDADAIFCDYTYNIEQFIDENYNIICTEDYGPSILNAGVFIFKNSKWTINFLKKWWDIGDELEDGKYKNQLWHDQTCFGHLITNEDDSHNNIKIISNKILNGRTYKDSNDKNFIFHAFSYAQTPNRTLDHAYYDILNIERPNYTLLSEMAQIYNTDKFYEHNYFTLIYDEVLGTLKHNLKTFIEIGVLNGESLLLWRDYFNNAKVIGMDINIDNTKESLKNKDNNRLEFYKLDTSDELDLINTSKNFSNVDVILDDASHRMYDQQITFAKFFKCLKSGGVFIIEDLHTSVEAINPAKSWCNWGDPNKTLTLNMLENFIKTGQIISDYINEEDKLYLENNIKSINIYKQKPDWSITSIIIKK
jgi:hypothetical protein